MILTSLKILIGLGNPGREYEVTRHNFGKRFVQHLVEKYSDKRESLIKKPCFYQTLLSLPNGKQIIAVLPDINMNNSGEIIPYLRPFFKDPTEILVAYDELDLEYGKIKLKTNPDRGLYGHNGLRSIVHFLQAKPYYLALGIGRPAEKSLVGKYVLQKFYRAEEEQIVNIFEKAEKTLLVSI